MQLIHLFLLLVALEFAQLLPDKEFFMVAAAERTGIAMVIFLQMGALVVVDILVYLLDKLAQALPTLAVEVEDAAMEQLVMALAQVGLAS
jgi:hypothetical protein